MGMRTSDNENTDVKPEVVGTPEPRTRKPRARRREPTIHVNVTYNLVDEDAAAS